MGNDERKSQPISISEVLQKVFQDGENPLSKPFMLWKVRLNWAEIVGPEIAKASRPIGYKKLTLFLNVNHPGVIQNMTFMNRQIIEKVNNYVGKKWVRSIRFTTLQKMDDNVTV